MFTLILYVNKKSIIFKVINSFPGATKYTDKDNGGMLVWSPYHSIPDTKCKFSEIECLCQQGSID